MNYVNFLFYFYHLDDLNWETGKVILESVILTAAVVVSLTLYTFWAAKRGHDFNFLGPFLFGAVVVLMLFALIQVCCFPTCLNGP